MILTLGGWPRTEVGGSSAVGLAIAKKFSYMELKRQARRKNTASDGA